MRYFKNEDDDVMEVNDEDIIEYFDDEIDPEADTLFLVRPKLELPLQDE